jgi:protein SCO1
MHKITIYVLSVLGLLATGLAAYTSGRLYAPLAATDLTVDAEGLHGTAFKPPLNVRAITLQHGEKSLRLGDFQGNILLIFFGYTHCPDICPLTMSKLAAIYRELGESRQVKVVMISVDPESDTPEVVQRYASSFHPSFIGLSGSNSQVAEAVQTFYVARNKLSATQITHTSAVYVLDRQTQVRRVYSGADIGRLEEDLATILTRQDY